LLLSVAVFAFVTSITPGPNNTFLLTSGINFGVRRSLPFVFGITTGLIAIMLAVGAGLGALFLAYPLIYGVLKWLGFAYVVYLAVMIAISTGKSTSGEAKYIGYWRAASLQFVNPKSVMMTVGFMTTFIHADDPLYVSITTAAVLLAVSFPSGIIWAASGAALSRWFGDPRRLKIFNRVSAVLLVASMLPVLLSH
jgi:threonine/homoserine/homoserine lactone efflux protein